MMHPDPRTTTTTTSTTSTAATSMINAASDALPPTPLSTSVPCAAGKVAKPSSSAPARKKATPKEIWLRADNVEKMVRAAVSFEQDIWTGAVIAELYKDLESVKKASESDTNVQSVWNTFYKKWESALLPLKEFVDRKRKDLEGQNEAEERARLNKQKMAEGLESKKNEIAAKKKEQEALAQKHKQEMAALAKAHRNHFNDPKALEAIVSENPTLCTAVVEGTDTMAFGISSVGNHHLQAFFRDKEGIIRCTKAAEVHAKVLEPLRATLAGIQKVEDWEVYVCAEVDAAVQLLLRGVPLRRIKTYATDFDLKYKPPCAHCYQWVTEI
ncbi:hypothetical protein [Polyangium sp. y55x31]|uniref:hypothetical protein n=1 Tax=Polyangium sp. y55x31 TaxID=3042688 RepID=UPI0024824851|nr:hypothetical protein [Polyangium sp. y55x31]MDI1484038.1 hypothetical protein [Polyangium sp. y55x31]